MSPLPGSAQPALSGKRKPQARQTSPSQGLAGLVKSVQLRLSRRQSFKSQAFRPQALLDKSLLQVTGLLLLLAFRQLALSVKQMSFKALRSRLPVLRVQAKLVKSPLRLTPTYLPRGYKPLVKLGQLQRLSGMPMSTQRASKEMLRSCLSLYRFGLRLMTVRPLTGKMSTIRRLQVGYPSMIHRPQVGSI